MTEERLKLQAGYSPRILNGQASQRIGLLKLPAVLLRWMNFEMDDFLQILGKDTAGPSSGIGAVLLINE